MNAWIRLLVFLPLWIFCCGLFFVPVFILYPESFSGSKAEYDNLMSSNHMFMILYNLATLFGTFCAIFFVTRIIEKQKILYLKSAFQIKGILYGSLIGAVLIVFGIIILSLINDIKIAFEGINIGIFYYFIIFLLVAVSEELMARGFILNTLLSKINKPLAVIISSIIFALMHIFNSSVNAIGLINIFLIGVVLSLLYLKRMSLSIPIGLHLSWNFLQGPVLGFSVSGHVTDSIFKITSKSGSDFSFQGFGLEGSLIITLIFVITILYFYISNKRYMQAEKSGSN